MPNYKIAIQNELSDQPISDLLIRRFVKSALVNRAPACEVCVRIVDIKEIAELNFTYRKKNKPTNVLSFPMKLPQFVALKNPPLGDIVICAEIVKNEAREQGKTLRAHWAHMLIHGTLHLLGYDHENESDAQIMESLEIDLMQQLGFENPYNESENNVG